MANTLAPGQWFKRRAVCVLAALAFGGPGSVLLQGCTHEPAQAGREPTAIERAIALDAQHWPALQAPVAAPDLDASHRHLRVSQGQQVAWLVYAGTDPWPQANSQLWISADRSVLRLSHGRLVALGHAAWQWQALDIDRTQIDEGRTLTGLESTVHQLPAGPVAQRQHRMRQRWPGAPVAHRFIGEPNDLQWWVEWTPANPHTLQPAGELAWAAFDPRGPQPQWVYGQRCLAGSQPLVCVSWQLWPAQAIGASR